MVARSRIDPDDQYADSGPEYGRFVLPRLYRSSASQAVLEAVLEITRVELISVEASLSPGNG